MNNYEAHEQSANCISSTTVLPTPLLRQAAAVSSNKMKHLPLIILASIIYSCTSKTDKGSTADNSSLAGKYTTNHLVEKEHEDGSDCVFDTSTYKFTTEAIKNYNSSLKYVWNDETKAATVWMDQSDTLILHIGGCDHFTYSAIYTTDQTLFDTDSVMLSKAKWIAKSFFSNGYNKGFMNAIDKNLFEIDGKANNKTVTLKQVVTEISDHVYEPILIEKINGRTRITLTAYQN